MTVIDAASVPFRLQLEYVDPRTVLLDKNIRLQTSADAEFVDSIRVHGILQPPAVVRTVDGGLRCKLGHRRTMGAIAAGLTEYPVLIAGDEATDDPGEIQRVLEQLVENDARAGLTALDQVHAVEQLAAFGLPAEQIAKKTRRSHKEVEAALAIAKSGEARGYLLSDPDVDLVQAALLAEFDDQPEAQERVAAILRRGWGVEHEVQRVRDELAQRGLLEQATEKLRELGIAAVGRDNVGYRRLDQLSIAALSQGSPISLDAHLSCPGHAAYPSWQYGSVLASSGQPVDQGEVVLAGLTILGKAATEDACTVCGCTPESPCTVPVAMLDDELPDGVEPGEDESFTEEACDWTDGGSDDELVCTACVDEEGNVIEARRKPATETSESAEEQPVRAKWLGPQYVCTDPAGNGHVSLYGGGAVAPKKKAAEMTEEERAAASAERKDVVDSNSGMDSAQTVRRRWLKEFLTRKTAPKGTAAFMLAIMADLGMDVDRAMGGGRRLAHELLGLGEPGMGRAGQASKLVEAAGNASDARAQVIALAFVLACCEDQIDRTEWRMRRPFAQAYFAFLDSCGYELADVERRVITGEKPEPAQITS